jgi:hypothetical protein
MLKPIAQIKIRAIERHAILGNAELGTAQEISAHRFDN